MKSIMRQLRGGLHWTAAIALALAAGCARAPSGTFYTGVGLAQMEPGKSFSEGRLAAIRLAEKKARDQILEQAADGVFAGGRKLGEAMIADPVLRAKVYDSIRTAKIAEQKVDDEGVARVTVKLDVDLFQKILEDPLYAGR